MRVGSGFFWTVQHREADGLWVDSNFDSIAAAGKAEHPVWVRTGEHGWSTEEAALEGLHRIRVANKGKGLAFRVVRIDYQTKYTPVDV